MNNILVTNIQRLCVSDGPGNRTVVFLKGCLLRCPWCCNPETIYTNQDLYYDNLQCIKDSNSSLCVDCELKGGERRKIDCPLKAYEKTFDYYSPKQLIQVLAKETSISTCDGITFSGGEPLLQVDQLEEVLSFLKSKKISIAIETSLFAPFHNVEIAMKYADLWIIDVKVQKEYFCNDGINTLIDRIKQNLTHLQIRGSDIFYRMVLVREILSNADSIASILRYLNIDKIEMLPVHNMAENKYKKLHRDFNYFSTPSSYEIDNFCQTLNKRGIETKTSIIE